VRKVGDGKRKSEVAFHRFLANRKVTVERLIAGWSERTAHAASGRHVLAIQDTSEICMTTRRGRRRGLGKVALGRGYGFLLHAMLALDAENESCLGLVSGEIWNRPRKVRTSHAKRTLTNKESRRWLTTGQKAKEILAQATTITIIADRESDIYAEWAQLPEPNFHLITRVMHDRRIAGDTTLSRHAQTLPARDTKTILLRGNRMEREAQLTLRFAPIAIERPENCIEPGLPKHVNLYLVDVVELNAPKGKKPVHWRLLTTHTVTSVKEAWQIVEWYKRRWIIEQLFRVLKSQGFELEDSQVESADRLTKLAAIAIHAAVLTIQLTQARDGKSAESASTPFDQNEIEALVALNRLTQGATQLQKNPHPEKSLAWAAWIIARRGGWDGYPSSRPPGPITFKDGLDYFKAFADAWRLKQDVCMP
jgi:hypothetical protein